MRGCRGTFFNELVKTYKLNNTKLNALQGIVYKCVSPEIEDEFHKHFVKIPNGSKCVVAYSYFNKVVTEIIIINNRMEEE